jgi:hypothetical protein
LTFDFKGEADFIDFVDKVRVRPWWFPLRKNPQSGAHRFRLVRAFFFLVALGLFLLLQRSHMRVGALLFQKLAMGAALNDAAVVYHQNLVGIDYGGQSVGYGKRGAVGGDAPKFRLNKY